MSYQILRLPDVVKQTGLSRSSIYAYVKAKKFPAPVRLSARMVGWLESDVQDFIRSRVEESRKDQNNG